MEDISEAKSCEINVRLLTEQLENEDENTIDKEPIKFDSKIDSDIEEESDDNEIFVSKSRNKKKAIFSDDEESGEENEAEFGTAEPDSIDDKHHRVKHRIISTGDTDSEDDRHSHELLEEKTRANIKYRSDIFDTEETDDEDPRHNPVSPKNTEHEDSDLEEMGHQDIDPKVKKKKEKKLSLKKRKEELQDIHSTTQKMVRESEIVLPYHKPRQRTLMEFLSRKKNVPRVDKSSTSKSSLIMTMMDIKHLKEIEERKKDIDKFYKDEVEEEDKMEESENDCNALKNNTLSKSSTGVCVEEALMEVQNIIKTDHFDEEGNKEQEEEKVNKEVQKIEMKNDEQIGKTVQLEETEKKMYENGSEDKKELPITDKSLNFDLVQKNSESNENCDTMKELLFLGENDLSKDGKMALNNKTEDDLKGGQENPILFSDDSEDEFRLHLDTEDFDNDIGMETDFLSKLSHKSSEFSNDPKSRNQRLSLLVSKFPELDLGNLTGVTPRLSLGEGAFVDLDDPTPKEETGVDALLSRFIEHSKKVKTPKKSRNVLLGVVSKEVSANGEEKLVHSNVTVKLEGENEDMSKCDTPGARLTLLRNTLKAKMLEEREKARQRREKEKEFLDSEKVIQDYHDDGLPDEEAELTDQSETDNETESEPEENDVIITDQKRKRNKYLDEEAEVDDDDDDMDNVDEGGDGLADDDGLSEAETIGEANSESEETEMKNEEVVNTQKRKSVSRIIDDEDEEEAESYTVAYQRDTSETENFKLCLEDTEETEELPEKNSPNAESGASIRSISRANTEELFSSQACEESAVNSKNELVTSTTMASMDQSFGMTGSVIPAAQHSREGQKLRNKLSFDVFGIDTPTASLTPFSKLRTTTPDILTRENSDKVECQSALSFLLTPLKATQGTSSTEESVKRTLLLESPSKSTENITATNADLMGLCSGTFAAGTYVKPAAENDMDDLISLCSGRFEPQRSEAKSAESSNKSSIGFPSYPDTVVPSSKAETINDKVENVSRTREEISTLGLSDEENSKRELARSKKRKKRKRIVNMDLSSDEEEEGGDGNPFADDEEDKENAWTSDEEEPMEYDENEEPIIEQFGGFKDSVRGGIKSDFLDKEAELSGSEEGSDDEEEPDEDNDFMEREEGDLERFDDEELRNQVGRAHLKSLIDSDKREIKLLQELYLEDGDLHGEGRQRKFRWKNLDDQDDGPNQQSEDEEKEEDVEEEADWRKQRFEREKYLQEKNGEQEDVHPSSLDKEITPILQRSSSLKLVKNLSIKRISSSTPSNSTPSQESPLQIQNSLKKRGSFLSRDANTLQRLASFTKDQDNVTVGGARQTGNFVFHTLTGEEVEKRSKEVARKSGRVTKPPEKKRLRIERSFFSMEETVQSASVFKHL